MKFVQHANNGLVKRHEAEKSDGVSQNYNPLSSLHLEKVVLGWFDVKILDGDASISLARSRKLFYKIPTKTDVLSVSECA